MLPDSIEKADEEGMYLIDLEDSEAGMDFPTIESSLRSQGFSYTGSDTGNTTDYIELEDGKLPVISIKYEVEKDQAILSLTDLSPTKETSLKEALTKGHWRNKMRLRELYLLEEDPNKDIYTFGTPEYERALDDAFDAR